MNPEQRQKRIAVAEARAADWLSMGNAALERGSTLAAARHFAKAEIWNGRAKELREGAPQ